MRCIPFADAAFDLIMNRHESYHAAEVTRVLAPGGLFLTQQVDGRDAQELRDWFGGEVSYPDVILEKHRVAAAAVGLLAESTDEWSGQMRFADAAALVEYLAMVPWTVPAFRVDEQSETLTRLDARRPIVVTQGRFRMTARKPAPEQTGSDATSDLC